MHYEVRLATSTVPVKRRAPHPARSAGSTFDDDQVLRVGPELRGIRDLHREGVGLVLLIVDHALQILHRRAERVAQAVGERGELLDALLARLEPRLDVLHARADVMNLLDERVARRAQRRLGGHLELTGGDVDLRELPADLTHETGVLGDLLHQAVALRRRLRQAVQARLHLGCRPLLPPAGGAPARLRSPASPRPLALPLRPPWLAARPPRPVTGGAGAGGGARPPPAARGAVGRLPSAFVDRPPPPRGPATAPHTAAS